MTSPGTEHSVGQQTVGQYVKLSDGTVWPNPADPNEVAWILRYGTPSKADLLFAASTMNAYQDLVTQTHKRRTDVVRRFRAALRP